jgi:hypothetical protein
MVCWWLRWEELTDFPSFSSQVLTPPSCAGEAGLAVVKKKTKKEDREENDAN